MQGEQGAGEAQGSQGAKGRGQQVAAQDWPPGASGKRRGEHSGLTGPRTLRSRLPPPSPQSGESPRGCLGAAATGGFPRPTTLTPSSSAAPGL